MMGSRKIGRVTTHKRAVPSVVKKPVAVTRQVEQQPRTVKRQPGTKA